MGSTALTNNGCSTRIYFDCNATTPVLKGATQTALKTMETLYGNPSSTHSIGLEARYILESSRQTIGQVLGIAPEQIIFTSGATEAIQMAVFSVLKACKDAIKPTKTKLLYGATEHKAVPQALIHWVKILELPYEIIELPVDHNGQIIIEKLQEELPNAALLCTMAVNNETGVIHNLEEIERTLIKLNSNAFWLVDCVQALGKIDLHLSSSRIDYATFSGHKLHAPKGTGFLYLRKEAPFTTLAAGGGQEHGYRSGTENLPGIAALGFVLNQLVSNENAFQPSESLYIFRNKLITTLKKIFPQIIFNTPLECSVPTTLNFSVPGLSSEELIDLFDQAGLYVSGGSACNAHSVKTSHVLNAMGITEAISSSAIRLSFSPCTTMSEIEQCCLILNECGLALNQTCLIENSTSSLHKEELQDGVLQLQYNGTNSWIITDKSTLRCIIIDPCQEAAERMEQYIKCHDLKIVAILDTHSHADHESIRPLLQQRLEHYWDTNTNHYSSLGWPIGNESNTVQIKLSNDEQVSALRINNTEQGELVLAQLATPGHTEDSIVFLLGIQKAGVLNKNNVQFVFSGDIILSGGLGRTNFPTSSPESLYYSLKKLHSVISPYTLLCPAHEYDYSFSTNFNTEIQLNSMMQLAIKGNSIKDLNEFQIKKIEVDEKLAELEKNFQGIVCGVTNSFNSSKDLNIWPNSKLWTEFLYNSPVTPLVISVFEEPTFSLIKDWDLLGFSEAPRNIPLTRINNLVRELISSSKFDQEIVFICKSGERSLLVAQAFRRLGFPHVRSIGGGIALLRAYSLLEQPYHGLLSNPTIPECV